MKFEATLTARVAASAAAHDDRDRAQAKSVNDLYSISSISHELEDGCAEAQRRLESLSKRLGLKPIGRPDLSYGLLGGESGPIEMWYQLRAS